MFRPTFSFTLLLVACAPAARAPAATPALVAPAPSTPCDAATASTSPPAAARPSDAAAPAAPSTSVPKEATPPPPAAFSEAVAAARKAIGKGDAATADKRLADAETLAGADTHLRYLVAQLRATREVYARDFDRAAASLLSVMPALTKHPELADEFWAHNAMMMIREAQGDPAAALAENDQATICAARGTWAPEERAKLALQKERWHRAYLTRMLAESRAGSVKDALIRYAESALDDYRPIGFPESIAVLEAYFAALDGKKAAALAAAKRVDPSKDDDVEDLYLVVLGLEAGGDHQAAEAVRRAMRRPGDARLSRAIMLRWLDLDADRTSPNGFTPWRSGARR